MGKREVQIIHIGRSHTAGDTVVWLPQERVLFAGGHDRVRRHALLAATRTSPTGPARWRGSGRCSRSAWCPAAAAACSMSATSRRGWPGTAAFTSDLFAIAKRAVAAGSDLRATYQQAMETMRPKYGHWVIFEHCMPFDVARAYDEAKGLDRPQIWTAERDVEMWRALESA